MSYTIEYWDIQTARGPYWMGPFNRLHEAQSAYSGYELRTKEHLYLIRKGHVPGENVVVAAILGGAWTDLPVGETWWTGLPDHALARIRINPEQQLSGRQLIEIISAGGSVAGSVTSRGQLAAHLTAADQQSIIPQSAFPEGETPGTSNGTAYGWAMVAALGTVVMVTVAFFGLTRRARSR